MFPIVKSFSKIFIPASSKASFSRFCFIDIAEGCPPAKILSYKPGKCSIWLDLKAKQKKNSDFSLYQPFAWIPYWGRPSGAKRSLSMSNSLSFPKIFLQSKFTFGEQDGCSKTGQNSYSFLILVVV